MKVAMSSDSTGKGRIEEQEIEDPVSEGNSTLITCTEQTAVDPYDA
ncbi:MAG: hypothetical protein ACREBR_00790 [bacterium]